MTSGCLKFENFEGFCDFRTFGAFGAFGTSKTPRTDRDGITVWDLRTFMNGRTVRTARVSGIPIRFLVCLQIYTESTAPFDCQPTSWASLKSSAANAFKIVRTCRTSRASRAFRTFRTSGAISFWDSRIHGARMAFWDSMTSETFCFLGFRGFLGFRDCQEFLGFQERIGFHDCQDIQVFLRLSYLSDFLIVMTFRTSR